ncbi:MAG TPA: DUF1778 domain-containing protein [Gammaproteobacteria bacterium]|jgi:uncharacterized protein (DUF1778 family)|nr:DUF1778 domain-containing protein [Gammaproteobacteria bacterium]
MPNASAKDERVTARVPGAARARLQRAADLSGATLNQFLVQSALKEAETVIERESVIRLSRQDATVFFAALERPAKPNRKLRTAVKAYRRAAHDAAD